MRGRGIALVAGARMGEKRAEANMAQQQQTQQKAAQAQQQSPAATPMSKEPGGGADITGQLQNLAQLHQSGALSDEEFATAKKKLLGT